MATVDEKGERSGHLAGEVEGLVDKKMGVVVFGET